MIAVLVTTHRADRGGAVPSNSVRFLCTHRTPHPKPYIRRSRSGAELCTATRLYAAPQHVAPWNSACRPSQAILAPLRADLCTILHLNFGEFPF
jgi:hypothetical protein